MHSEPRARRRFRSPNTSTRSSERSDARGSATEFQRTAALLESLRWLPFDRACVRRSGEIQASLLERGEPIAMTDCLIAAMAIEHREPLVSRDTDFERIEELQLYTY
ncbi:type II toxin-antitoxin system VapC family toxin [Natronobiforma cellulositropha]|uniref:type II toxin-antitoxin system VapC family toxin n=1 Tax=Natronobiforma cellulositropha TaxID=1679076 RepID=UPI0021D5E36F|nr:type II toxin-antitoxin system VapC family toxin [Natronobiforma cellulositropha]